MRPGLPKIPDPSRAEGAQERDLAAASVLPGPVVALEHVGKIYRGDGQAVHALEDVSLEISPGALAALVGRSGCGKSTLLNLAGAMDFPTAGRVLLEGVCTSSLHDDDLTRLRRFSCCPH
jgi:putative ABC transport system ATP-binding protein